MSLTETASAADAAPGPRSSGEVPGSPALPRRQEDEQEERAGHARHVDLTEYLTPYGAGAVMVLVSNVTAPIRANALPSSVAPVSSVID